MTPRRMIICLAAAGAVVVPGGIAFAAPTTTAGPYYKTCADAPHRLLRGDPGYRPALDRDSDGVACEERGLPRTTVTTSPASTSSTVTSTTVATTTTTADPDDPGTPVVRATPQYTG